MISTLSIICIFLQIFTTGVAISAAYSFFRKNYETKTRAYYYLGLIFVSISIFTALTVLAQIFYTLGTYDAARNILYRIIAVDLVAGSLFIAYYMKEEFSFKDNLLFNALLIACIGEIFLLIRSPINVVQNIADIGIDPGVHFIGALPTEFFWVTLWLILGLKFLSVVNKSKPVGERNVDKLSGIAALLVVVSFAFSFYYAKSGNAMWLMVSWLMYLCSAIGFFWGNIISPKDEIAKYPLSYFRTRILYKLILIFILLLVILLEATTIATINLNQISLENAIKANFMNNANNIADKIGREKLDRSAIQSLIEKETKDTMIVYVVSGDEKLYAGPDPKEVGRDLSDNAVVQKVVKGLSGSQEYNSDFFESAESGLVLGAYSPVPKYNLGVIVEEPKWEVYSDIRLVSTDTLILVIIGIFLTISAGIFFAKSFEASIKELIDGTQAVRKGDLSYKIKINSMDEIGQLAEAFNQMTKELKQSQDHLLSSEKLASLGTMAAGMAHEIKNPLVSLRTFTQLLPQRFEDAEFRQKFSTVVPQEIDKINKIAESLLRFGRPHKPELTQVAINEVLEEILALFDNEARKNNIRVTTKLAELPKITGDPGQLSQAFVNIILNAIQAMSGGGELMVKTDVGEIIKLNPVASETEEEEEAKSIPVVFVEVTDTGPGIPEENMKKIFDPFFTTKEVGGTGMGLPITQRIIEEHHGSIRVKSQVGKGTTFLITLPQSLEGSA
jgi:signal transduction histidine kinase